MDSLISAGDAVPFDYLAEWVAAQDDPVYLVVTDSGYVSAHLDRESAEQDYMANMYADDNVQLVQKAVGRSRQRKHGGGKFKSERQRRFMWAVTPRAAKKWARNRKTRKPDWAGAKRSVREKISPR